MFQFLLGFIKNMDDVKFHNTTSNYPIIILELEMKKKCCIRAEINQMQLTEY